MSAVTAGRVDHINVRPPATLALLELTNPDVQLEARMTVEQDRLKVLSHSIGEQIALQQVQIAKLKASVASMEEERGTLAVDDGRQLEESCDRVVSRGTDLRRVAATFSRAGRAPHAPSRAPLCLDSALPPSPITSQRRRGSHVSVRRFDSGREPAVVKSIDGVGTRDIRSHVIVRPARQSVGINACCATSGGRWAVRERAFSDIISGVNA